MIDSKIILDLLRDTESDRAERTVSTKDTDKYGEAICAFANDLPNHNKPGYLILGATDDGKIKGLNVTDELLKNIAAIRTDGNIQPQPSMVVEKMSFPEGDLLVAEVQPSNFPPVRYKGRIWIRVGPRKAIANEADEKQLFEKRISGITAFDALPCIGTSIDDLDLKTFRLGYLPMAFPEEVLEQDKRNVKWQLQSLGFYDIRFDCPTYAGIIMFGKNVERFLAGAYIQYVRFKGQGRAGEIQSEHKFAGNLFSTLSKLDTFIDTTITNRRPVPVSALREETVCDYPYWSTRELICNAICHRDWESKGPVQFYQYDDRIEILNPGGLYGKVRPENFPFVNDYRNGVIAEAMKVMGFVNRFSRGVLRVEEELQESGNGKPVFNLNLITAFMVTEYISHRAEEIEFEPRGGENGGEMAVKDAKNGGENGGEKNGKLTVNSGKAKVNGGKGSSKSGGKTDGKNGKLIMFVASMPKLTMAEYAKRLNISQRQCERMFADMKQKGLITRVGGARGGYWKIMDDGKHLTD